MDVRPAHDGPGAVITTPGHTAAGPSSTTPTPPPPPARAPSRSRIEADVCAVALATCALCPSAEFFEITDYVTELKTNLELPNASLLCCLMMYAQSLMLRTEEGWTWHAALTAGTVLACKSVFDEAFCLSDMLDATSDKYTLAELEHLLHDQAALRHKVARFDQLPVGREHCVVQLQLRPAAARHRPADRGAWKTTP